MLNCYKSRKGPLPQCIRDFIIEAYRYKTSLKGLPGELNETLYNKSKNRINGIYGLMATNPIRQGIEYMAEDRDFHFDEHTTEAELFARCKKSYWLPYQFGIWTTANARFELYRCARLASHGQERGFHDLVYCDTDSVKYIGDVDFSEYNKEKIRLSTESGAYAVDAKGKTHYMGALERDGFYVDFKSAGPKEFLTLIDNAQLVITSSFHAVAFSVILHTQFIAVKTKNEALFERVHSRHIRRI